MAWPWVTAIKETVGGVFDLAKAPIEGWQERKTLKVQTDNEIRKIDANTRNKRADAQIEMAKNGQVIEADYDARAQDNMKHTWKDEYLVVLLFLPVLMLFISPLLMDWFPNFQNLVIGSVKALDEFPSWYTFLLTGIVIATFGLRWYYSRGAKTTNPEKNTP